MLFRLAGGEGEGMEQKKGRATPHKCFVLGFSLGLIRISPSVQGKLAKLIWPGKQF